ncbi:MAG: FAD-dependent oxidoreductase [bacterium]
MSSTRTQNVVIIGGGPAGLAAAIYLARAQLTPLVFAGSPPGGQLTLTSEVENYPGVPSKLGPELITTMRTQAESFGATIIDSNVTKVTTKDSVVYLETEHEGEYKSVTSATLLIATGAKALWLDIPNEARLRGKGVSACATCDGFFFRNKTVVVAGGGDTAIEEAMHLTKYASKVYLVHRRDTLRASKIMQTRLFANEKIEVVLNSQIVEVLGDQKVEGIRVKQSHPSSPEPILKDIPTQGLFVAIGHKPDTDLFADLVKRDAAGYILTMQSIAQQYLQGSMDLTPTELESLRTKPSPFSQTTNEFIFSAGDCVDRWYRQAATAAGMGVAASLDIERYLQH